MNNDSVKNKIENIISCGNVSVDIDEKKDRIIISKDDYGTEDGEELSQAWEDFKSTNKELKDHRLNSIFDENTVPNFYEIYWEIVLILSNTIRRIGG